MTDLERRADALLAAIGRASPGIGDGVLTLHWPTVGASFDHGVLVIGQAVFGWMNGFTADEALDPAGSDGLDSTGTAFGRRRSGACLAR